MKTKSILKLPGLVGITAWLSTLLLSACIVVSDYGPNGRPGKAYFGIDYDFNPPYSYWDNNPNVPNNPFFGEYYRTNPGNYSFEYFLNPYEYWYGTYQIRVNIGQPGQPHGVPGRDGTDTYLMLICNDQGFYFENWEDCNCWYREADGSLVYEFSDKDRNYRIEMKKTTIAERAPQGVSKYKID